MTKVLLTGGGTAGHVMGNLAILPGLRERGYEVVYMGSKNGIEGELIAREGLPYYAISSGKLRRYPSLENFRDIFRVLAGLKEARRLLREIKPDLIFSKGGYVTVPVAAAAHALKIPFIGHESDITPGLANRLASHYAMKMLVTFPETRAAFGEKGVVTGSPLRKELFAGSRQKAYEFLGFGEGRPLLLIMGGSLGARILNRSVWDNLDELLERFQIVHLIGRGNGDPALTDRPSYRQFEYIGKEMKDLLTAADFIVSRAGSNSIFEFLALRKPNLLIPLDYDQSRGDQVLNAQSFEAAGYSLVLREKELSGETLLAKLAELQGRAAEFTANMEKAEIGSAVETILDIIDQCLAQSRQMNKPKADSAKSRSTPFFRKTNDHPEVKTNDHPEGKTNDHPGGNTNDQPEG